MHTGSDSGSWVRVAGEPLRRGARRQERRELRRRDAVEACGQLATGLEVRDDAQRAVDRILLEVPQLYSTGNLWEVSHSVCKGAFYLGGPLAITAEDTSLQSCA